jgi:hypothetical protein
VAIFAFVDAALIRPLPYWNPHPACCRDRKCRSVWPQQPFLSQLS